jgi:large subunit ribosomal protein L19e
LKKIKNEKNRKIIEKHRWSDAVETDFAEKDRSEDTESGESRVWIDPAQSKDAQAAITRIDVKNLIKKGVIKRVPGKVRMPKVAGKGWGGRARTRKGHGSRKGGRFSRLPRKRRWINIVRPLRKMLAGMRAAGEVDKSTYKKLYMLVKGGQFRSRSHLRIYMEQHGMLKKPAEKGSGE